MKKMIEKNPIKAQRIALVILFIVFGITSFLALLSFPVLGWFSLAFTCFSIYLFTTSIKIQALKKKELEEEALNNLKNMFSNLNEVSNEEEN